MQEPFISDIVESYEEVLDGATSGALTLTVPAVVTPYTVILPAVQGLVGTTLTNDGSGNLSWTTPTDVDAFALQDLSNLTSPTAINQDLIPAANITESLGTAVKRWLNGFIQSLFVQGISSTAVSAKNLAGTVTLVAGIATVTFAAVEADTNYRISLSGNQNGIFWWSAKSTAGFTIQGSSSKGPIGTANVDWHLLR
jgi:hypothetical protein